MPPEAAQRALREASLELARLRRIRGASHRTWRRIAHAKRRIALAAALLAAPAIAEPAAAIDPLFRHGFLFDGGDFAFELHATPSFADIDGDGDVDVFVASGTRDFVENTGTLSTPAFAQPVSEPHVPGVYVWTATFADIDGDGDLDRFEGVFSGETLFSENTGSANAPAFAARSTNPFGLASMLGAAAPAFADLDDDGDLDAFVGSQGDTVLFENTGGATAPAFAAPATNPFGLVDVGYMATPTFADLDGDGDLDAVIGTNYGDFSFFENTGTASAPAFGAPAVNPFGLARAARYQGALAFADVDGDGDLDALIGGYYAVLSAFENTGTAASPAFTSAANPFGLGIGPDLDSFAYAAPTFADLDGDGDLDAFVGDADGAIQHLENTGTAGAPSFTAPSTHPYGLADVGTNARPALADVDADGDLDALIGNSAGNTLFFPNTGTAAAPAFAAAQTNPFGLLDVGSAAAPTLGDLDDDGDLDLVMGRSDGNLLVFSNTGNAGAPAFAAPLTNPFGLADVGTGAQPELADFDGDGDLDLLVGEVLSGLVYFENTGSAAAPAFAAPASHPFGLADGGSVPSPAAADLDGDGDLDVLVGDYTGRISWFENVVIDPDACADGLDNDGDTRVDFGDDPGCASAADTSELGTLQCDNGLDDDGDGLVDSADPHCTGPLDDREAPTQASPGCGLGPELIGLVPFLAALRRRRDRTRG